MRRNQADIMRPTVAAGNWKMHGSRDWVANLIHELRQGVDADGAAQVIVFPPYVYLHQAAELLAGSGIALGAQNVSERGEGAFTGEVSGKMLADIGCEYVLVGHSERRALFGETDELVAAKFAAAQACGLRPVLCVGETLAERQAGETENVVQRQVGAILASSGVAALENAMVAYEPVWAIGTGETATPEQAQEIHALIRAQIAAEDDNIGGSLPILYGGSVKGSNAAELFAMADVDGGLVGGASLDHEQFLEICSAADR